MEIIDANNEFIVHVSNLHTTRFRIIDGGLEQCFRSYRDTTATIHAQIRGITQFTGWSFTAEQARAYAAFLLDKAHELDKFHRAPENDA